MGFSRDGAQCGTAWGGRGRAGMIRPALVRSGPVKARELQVPDAWEFTPTQFPDDRGVFLNWYTADAVADAVGHPLHLAQTNHSVSRRGVVRGVHYAMVPPSQAKYVYCPSGAILDV